MKGRHPRFLGERVGLLPLSNYRCVLLALNFVAFVFAFAFVFAYAFAFFYIYIIFIYFTKSPYQSFNSLAFLLSCEAGGGS